MRPLITFTLALIATPALAHGPEWAMYLILWNLALIFCFVVFSIFSGLPIKAKLSVLSVVVLISAIAWITVDYVGLEDESNLSRALIALLYGAPIAGFFLGLGWSKWRQNETND